MNYSPFDLMQQAVDIVLASPHPTSKVAATLARGAHAISRFNDWPAPIRDKIGTETEIGNSSGTLHAETACIFASVETAGASLFLTDPFCPNCAKNIAEAGIASVYIDHKGFDKDFFTRRGDAFTSMSMRIMQKAGISVFEIRRREQALSPIFTAPDGYEPFNARPVEYRPAASAENPFLPAAPDERRHFATAIARKDGVDYAVRAFAAPVIGYSYTRDEDWNDLHQGQGKYSYIQEPLNRLMMNARRHGMAIADGTITCTRVPTSRELVNLAGFGATRIAVINKHESRDPQGIAALRQLVDAGILNIC